MDNETAKLSDLQVRLLARPLVSIVEDYYKDPENEKRFQQWLKQQSRDERSD